MSITGRLEFVDLGPGQWVLRTGSGDVSLFGEIDASLAGREVVVDGDAIDGASASMVAARAVAVRSVRAR